MNMSFKKKLIISALIGVSQQTASPLPTVIDIGKKTGFPKFNSLATIAAADKDTE